MNNNKRSFSPPMVGASSLLSIFAVLCLTVFALLTLSTVQAESRLQEASSQAISDYYAADCQAEEILAALRAGQIPDGVTEENSVYRYICPISETQELQVEVMLDGSDYTILRWQAVSASEWQPDDSLDVWEGLPE